MVSWYATRTIFILLLLMSTLVVVLLFGGLFTRAVLAESFSRLRGESTTPTPSPQPASRPAIVPLPRYPVVTVVPSSPSIFAPAGATPSAALCSADDLC